MMRPSVFSATLFLPLFGIVVAMLFTFYTLVWIPLTILSSAIGLIGIGLLFFLIRRKRLSIDLSRGSERLLHGAFGKVVRILCWGLLAITFLFSFSHAVILPTYQIDSLTNWTMRSKVSYYDQMLALDESEVRGVAKPQYPILFHSLQIISAQAIGQWNDHLANAVLWLLSLSTCFAIFFLLRALRGPDHALLGVTLFATTPLLAFHLAQGYADIHLTGYLCLSLLFLLLWRRTKEWQHLVLSAVFVSGAAWTKSEGTIIGIGLWILLLLPLLREKSDRKSILAAMGVCVTVILPFYILLLTNHMGLTPHASDTAISCRASLIPTILSGMFAGGSFGIIWFIIPIPVIALMHGLRKKKPGVDGFSAYTSLWGTAALAIVLFTYICTPNAQFLEHGQSFYRQLMPPLALLLLSLITAIPGIRKDQ